MTVMLRNLLLLLFVFLMLPSVSEAQRWKRRRYELSLGLGASNFLGDLGGANQIGTHYFRDLNWVETRYAAALGLRYKLSEYFALNTHLTYARVAGDDKLTQEYFRHYRNLNFSSPILEFNVNFEAAFQKEQLGHIYRLSRVRGIKGYELYTYGFAGLGIFYFNPTTELNGQTYDLHDYHTEGEGLPGGPPNYNLVGVCIPIGIGFKYTIDQDWGIGLEIGIRKTFTDYIDDVSSNYYINPQLLASTYGPIANQLADRSNGSQPQITAPGAQRGQSKYNDSYMFAIFSVNVKIRNTTNMLPRF